jgi:hypothetical protein
VYRNFKVTRRQFRTLFENGRDLEACFFSIVTIDWSFESIKLKPSEIVGFFTFVFYVQ